MSYIFDARFDNLKSQATYYIILKFKKLLLYKLNRRNFFNLKFFYLISQKIYILQIHLVIELINKIKIFFNVL